jgi:hypothetical protein
LDVKLQNLSGQNALKAIWNIFGLAGVSSHRAPFTEGSVGTESLWKFAFVEGMVHVNIKSNN